MATNNFDFNITNNFDIIATGDADVKITDNIFSITV